MSLTAMLGLVYALKEMTRHGWQPVPIAVGLAGIVLSWGFVRRQRGLAEPLLEIALFRIRSFSAMVAGLLLYGIIGASSVLFVTQFLQSVTGLTAFEAALYLVPGMLAGTLSAMVSPLLGRRIRPAYLIGGGVLGVAAVFGWFTQLDPDSNPLVLAVGFALLGLLEGPLLSLGTNLVVGAAPPEKAGSSSSVVQMANEVGAALGVAIMGSIGAAVYVGQLASTAPAGLPGHAAAAAKESVAGAVAVGTELPPAIGEPLLVAARAAFTDGMTVYAGISVAVLVVAAAVIISVLRHVPPTGQQA